MAINFPIVTTFDDKAVKKADDAFKKLGKTFLAAFSVTKVVQFGKASIKAFSDAEQEARLLNAQLNSINLGFASPYLNQFIDKLALATGKTGGELTNAFVALSQATGDATTAQKILATALDVSLGTGKDLQAVSVALQRAYKGETTALARLRIGLTTAELKGKDFDQVLGDLQRRFKGAAADATDTYAVKMARLAEAVDQAKEAFGKGLVGSLQDSGIEIEKLQTDIINLGKALGDTAAAAIVFGDKVINAFARITESAPAKALMALFEGFTRFVVGPIVFGEAPGDSFATASAKRRVEAARAEEKAASARLRTQNALSRVEAKRLDNEKKITNEKKKQAQASGILNEINKRFEMDRIQIAAALGGKINEVERLRLELMKAILDEDVKRAIILEGQLIKAESAAAELAALLDSLDTLVDDPFADWPGTITRIKELLQQLNIKIPIETLFAEKGLRLDQDKMTVTKLERMDVNANNVFINGAGIGMGTGAAGKGFVNPSSILDEAAAALYRQNNPIIIPAVEEHANALLTLAESELALADLLLIESGGKPEITVNVQVDGSVISQNDLTSAVLEGLYEVQKTGSNILVGSTNL